MSVWVTSPCVSIATTFRREAQTGQIGPRTLSKKRHCERPFYILDEPTTGFAFQGILKLLMLSCSRDWWIKGNTVAHLLTHNLGTLSRGSTYIVDFRARSEGIKAGNIVDPRKLQEQVAK